MLNPYSFLRSRLLTLLTLQAGALALSIAAAQAGPLLPGSTLSPAPSEPDPIGGTTLSSSTSPFVAGTFHGSLTSIVLSGDTSNPFGGLTFVYQVSNASDSRDDIFRMTVDGFDGMRTDASYNPTAVPGGVPPSVITRSSNGQVVGFNFGLPAFSPGTFSAALVVQTDSPSFMTSTATFIDGSGITVGSLAPVPEPSVWVLAGLGGLGFLALGRWRRRTNVLR